MSDSELDELAALAPAGSVIGLRFETERDGRGVVRPEEAALRAHRAVPRLVEEVRRLRRELDATRDEAKRAAARPAAAASAPAARRRDDEDSPAAEELGSLLAAPFRVSSEATSAAKDDPLMALAVQVARGLAEDASELDRARLLAMAFAASEKDMEAFWAARRRRTVGAKAARKK
ncbi:MAG TPA: hypothetical protein VF310_08515 [Vicinamibacteria bacterium]